MPDGPTNWCAERSVARVILDAREPGTGRRSDRAFSGWDQGGVARDAHLLAEVDIRLHFDVPVLLNFLGHLDLNGNLGAHGDGSKKAG